MRTLLQLHEDCLYKLFERLKVHELTVLKQTCKAMRNAVDLYMRKYMTVLDFSNVPHRGKVSGELVKSIIDNAPEVKVLRLSDLGCNWWDRRKMSQIKVLDLSDCKKIPWDCCDLYKIEELSELNSGCLEERVLCKIAENNHNIESLYAPFCNKLDDSCFNLFVENNKSLRFVHIEGYFYNPYTSFKEDSFCNLARNCPNLQSLEIRVECDVTDKLIVCLSKNSKHLKELIIGNPYRYISISSISCLAENCLKLSILKITTANKITDESFFALAKFSKALRVLCFCECYKITDIAIKAVVESCPKLEEFVPNENITDDTLEALCMNTENLKKLDLSSCEHISESSLQTVAKFCKKLKSLYIHYKFNVTNIALKAVATGCEIEEFRLGHDISEEALINVIMNAKYLTKIDLRMYRKITDETAYALAQFSKNLEVVKLPSWREMTDHANIAIIEGCPNLKQFQPHDSLTDETLFRLGYCTTNLLKLGLYDCKLLTSEGMTEFANRFASKKLQIISGNFREFGLGEDITKSFVELSKK